MRYLRARFHTAHVPDAKANDSLQGINVAHLTNVDVCHSPTCKAAFAQLLSCGLRPRACRQQEAGNVQSRIGEQQAHVAPVIGAVTTNSHHPVTVLEVVRENGSFLLP